MTSLKDYPHSAKQIAETTRSLDIIFESDEVSDQYKEMLYAVLVPEAIERNMTAFEPELMRYSFPLLLEKLGADDAHGLLFTVKNMVDSIHIPQADKEYYDIRLAAELSEYPAHVLFAAMMKNTEIAFDEREKLVNFVEHNISAKVANFARTQEAFERVEPSTLADKISEILNDENLPAAFVKAIGETIDEHSLPQAIRDSPDYVQKVIDSMNGENLNLSEMETTNNSQCLDFAKHLSAVITSPLIPDGLHDAMYDAISGMGKGKTLKKVLESPEYLAKVVGEQLELDKQR